MTTVDRPGFRSRRAIGPAAPVTDIAPSVADEAAVLDWLAGMREHHPVWRDRWGVHHVFRHADVVAVLGDPARFSSDMTMMVGGDGPPPGMLTQLDPPDHRPLRSLAGRAFTPRRVAELEPRIREVTRDRLDHAGDRFDLVEQLARPLPITVISELLGLPAADHGLFRQWADALFDLNAGDPAAPETAEQMMEVFRPLSEYLGGWCRTRRADPGDDLISALVTSEVDGRRTTEEEATHLALLLLIAGHITTTVHIGNVVRTLDEHPSLWSAVRDDPGLVPDVVEEALRFRPPFSALQRVTTTGVEIAGTTVPERALVQPWLLSANRDPDAHPDPDTFDVRRGIRGPNQLTLGRGIHFCLGAPLARLEARVVLEEVTRRWDRLVVDRDADLDPYRFLLLGTRRLPVRAVPARG